MAIHSDSPSEIPVRREPQELSKENVLNVSDSRTGRSYVIPIIHNAISAVDFQKIKAEENKEYPADQDQNGLRVYDPGFQNTAVKTSKITYV